jgi:hypothetical protein
MAAPDDFGTCLLVVVVMHSPLSTTVVCWSCFLLAALGRRRKADFDALRLEHFVRYGEIVTGPGKAYVHLANDHPTRVKDAVARREA